MQLEAIRKDLSKSEYEKRLDAIMTAAVALFRQAEVKHDRGFFLQVGTHLVLSLSGTVSDGKRPRFSQ